MPTLQRRKDGVCIVLAYYQGNHTWQILGDGVRYLERRSIKEGDSFSTDIFMELFMRGFVYHGNTPSNRPATIAQDTVTVKAVRTHVTEFHKKLFTGQTDLAWALVWHGGREPQTYEQFLKGISWDDGRRLTAWKIKDIVGIYNFPAASESSLDGPRRFANVAVQISLANSAAEQCYAGEMQQYWLDWNDRWRVLWTGFPR